MWTFPGLLVATVLVYAKLCRAEPDSNYFCRKLSGQNFIDMTQLEGTWYLIEKIDHMSERHLSRNSGYCPVIHISQTNSYMATEHPLAHLYGSTYGSGYPHYPDHTESTRNPTDPKSHYPNEKDYQQAMDVYDRKTTYDHSRRHMQSQSRDKYFIKYITMRISYSFNNNEEHRLRYNTTSPGFWIMSGPEPGVPDLIQHFAGTIQVLKAVGSHLVLTVCKSHIELYTMILVRDLNLEKDNIVSVHSQLLDQALYTNYIEKSCNAAGDLNGLSYAVLSALIARLLIL